MGQDDSSNHIQLTRAEPVAMGKAERFEPELARLVLALDVDVRGLIAVEAGEEEAIRPSDPFDPRHSQSSLQFTAFLSHSLRSTESRRTDGR
jgi:hypothetical protein